MLRYHPTIIQDILYRFLLGLLHIMLLQQIGCQRHLISVLLYYPNSQLPCGLFYHSCWIPCWSRSLLQTHCNFCFRFRFPRSLTLCGRTCHTCCIHPWRIYSSCFSIYFLRRLMLENYLMVFIFYSVCPLFSSVFQNQHISFFSSLNCILEMFTLQDTLICLHS